MDWTQFMGPFIISRFMEKFMQRQNCEASVCGVLIKEEATVNRKATGTLAGHPVAHRLEQLCLLSISMIPAKKIIIKDLRETMRAC